MQDLTGKTTGSSLSATEWNQLPTEVQNIITALGITLASGDLNQLGKALAGYVANGDFYTDSGAADAYVLTAVGGKQAPPAYTDGMRIRFSAVNANSGGAATVNVAGLGVKGVTDANGDNPDAGSIGGVTEAVFSLSNNRFELVPKVTKQNIEVFSASGTYSKPGNLSYVKVYVTGGGGGGGATGGAGETSAGGYAAGTAVKVIEAAALSANEVVTIGAGGAGATSGDGSDGGTSSFGSHCSATGGPGGQQSGSSTTKTPGIGVNGDLNLYGGFPSGNTNVNNCPSLGGASYWGGGAGTAGTAGTDGQVDALSPGSGGSGGFTATGDGGDGQDGIIVVEEYLK